MKTEYVCVCVCVCACVCVCVCVCVYHFCLPERYCCYWWPKCYIPPHVIGHFLLLSMLNFLLIRWTVLSVDRSYEQNQCVVSLSLVCAAERGSKLSCQFCLSYLWPCCVFHAVSSLLIFLTKSLSVLLSVCSCWKLPLITRNLWQSPAWRPPSALCLYVETIYGFEIPLVAMLTAHMANAV